MPVAIDTSVLIAAEKQGGIEQLLLNVEGLFYIPALAATEFLVGVQPPVASICGKERCSFMKSILG